MATPPLPSSLPSSIVPPSSRRRSSGGGVRPAAAATSSLTFAAIREEGSGDFLSGSGDDAGGDGDGDVDAKDVGGSLRSSRSSAVSITLDDLDPRARGRDRSSFELDPTHVARRPTPDDPAAAAVGASAGRASDGGGRRSVLAKLRSKPSFSLQPPPGSDADPPPNRRRLPVLSGSRDNAHTDTRQQQQQQQQQQPQPQGTHRHRERHATILRRSLATRSSMESRSTVGGGTNPVGAEGWNGRDPPSSSAVRDRRLQKCLAEPAWRAASLAFILILLLGPPIQDCWMPKTADDTMDVIYSISFLALLAEVVVRCIADKSYFARDCEGGTKFRYCFRTGSFMFWFDTISLFTIFARISYINPRRTQITQWQVHLDGMGFPTSSRSSSPLNFNWSLLLTVARVGLMARFIRTSVLVNLTGVLFWTRFFSPAFWWRKLRSKCRRAKKKKREHALISQRVLASTSRVNRDDHDASAFSVSTLGDSRRRSARSSRRYSATELEGDHLETCEEEAESPTPVPEEIPRSTAGATGFFRRRFSRKESDSATGSLDAEPSQAPGANLLLGKDPDDSGSHVGAAMREITGQRIATGALMALLVTLVCNWHEADTTNVLTMSTLYGQTANPRFARQSVDVARSSVIPSLFNYTRANSTGAIFSATYELNSGDVSDLREREICRVEVRMDGSDVYTYGLFDNSEVTRSDAKVELVTEILLLIVWILGVASFAGPIMRLIVQPIERMVRLLSMLMKDPLGYQSTPQYRKLKHEEDEIASKSLYSKEVLKGMETNFLMSTILRIGSLMRVGFGSAGVEIIRNNLERGRHKDVLYLSREGSSVSCIFLFCDIRQFTDATECLQEEVFVFTNKIAAVVHSICHSYGGSANKNIGDAFLVTWQLDETPSENGHDREDAFGSSSRNLNIGDSDFYANNNQADKALLSVVKISMALHYDDYYVDGMQEAARDRLLEKLSKRKGPIVQMGIGLHAGKAVQGAIGSQRKLDATYISESVERSEFLESSTKQYSVPLLMSDAFYNLLGSSNRLRCRKIDQLLLLTGEDGDLTDPHDILDSGEKMSIYTFDMDIDALWKPPGAEDDVSTTSTTEVEHRRPHAASFTKRRPGLARRASLTAKEFPTALRGSNVRSSLVRREGSRDLEESIQAVMAEDQDEKSQNKKSLVLPTGVRHYNERVWTEKDIKDIRKVYVSSGIIFPKYKEGNSTRRRSFNR
ncbi:hypothetical protein ACHAWF_012613 [Thalassiosira exigua]